MPGYQIRSRFARHSSGTKAYQIYEIQADNAVAVVFQYGSWATGMDLDKMGGKVIHEGTVGACTAETMAVTKQNEKSRLRSGGRYEGWTVRVVESINSSTELGNALVRRFGKQKATEIFDSLRVGVTSEPEPSADPDNVVMGKAKPIAPATEQSLPEWGTW